MGKENCYMNEDCDMEVNEVFIIMYWSILEKIVIREGFFFLYKKEINLFFKERNKILNL